MRPVLALALLLGGALAARVQMEPSVKVFSHKNWIKSDRVTEADTVKLQFHLKHCPMKVQEFEAELLELATPTSPKYGQWLSQDEVTDRLAPSQESLDTVLAFLNASAVEGEVNAHRDAVTVIVPAPVAEKLVGTPLFHFKSALFPKVDIVRVAGAYSLPAEVADVVSLVSELIRFPTLRVAETRDIEAAPTAPDASSSWTSCGTVYESFVNVAVLAERYGFEYPVSSVASGNAMAVAEFQGQYYDDTDLEAFSSQCGLDTVSVTTTYGGNNPTKCSIGLEPCVEALLDIEYMGGVSQPIPMSVYYSNTYSLLDWATTINDNDDAEYVQSVSYGNDEVQQTSDEYMYTTNTEFMKLGSKGVSVFFASGDQGVWGRSGFGTEYHPDFPASSPYVTAVGGTDFATKGVIGDETTWEDGGGGFSNTFAQPSWQADAVESFFSTSTDLPKSSLYNSTGRGYPDIAALAGTQNAYFISFKDGKFGGVGGTSAACPVAAAIFAQVNNARLAAGKSAMGWLNPFIYANEDAFNDVTSGTNDGGYSSGFTAVAGWDAATGFGTPNYAKLEAAALSYS